MFERLFDYTVGNGPRILFAIAILVFGFGLFTSIWNSAHQSMEGSDVLLATVGGLFGALAGAAPPLIAAIVLERYPPRT